MRQDQRASSVVLLYSALRETDYHHLRGSVLQVMEELQVELLLDQHRELHDLFCHQVTLRECQPFEYDHLTSYVYGIAVHERKVSDATAKLFFEPYLLTYLKTHRSLNLFTSQVIDHQQVITFQNTNKAEKPSWVNHA